MRNGENTMANFVLRRPVLLYETIETLYQWTNNISVERRKADLFRKYGTHLNGEERQRMEKICQELQKVYDICDQLPEDPAIQYYFGKWETESQWQNICLAKLMVYSFLDIRITDFEDSLSQTLTAAETRLSRPFLITDINSGGISFRTPAEGETVPTLIAQLEQLALGEQYCWRIYKLLQDFPKALQEMASLLEPVARQIAPVLERVCSLAEKTYENWSQYFSEHSIQDLLENVTNQTIREDSLDVYINISLMAVSDILFTYDTQEERPFRQLYLGVLLSLNIHLERLQTTDESVCGLLRVLGDRSKFEILRRISHSSTYCQALSREMGLTTATISRHMSLLLDAGLVRAQRKENRIYYDLERQALSSLLDTVKNMLLAE